MRSPKDAIVTALLNAPTPIAVKRSPCPVAPTERISRANIGKSVVKGTISSATSITTISPVRTSSLRQLNFQPSTTLSKNEVSLAVLSSAAAGDVVRDRSCIVQSVASAQKIACVAYDPAVPYLAIKIPASAGPVLRAVL